MSIEMLISENKTLRNLPYLAVYATIRELQRMGLLSTK